MSTCLISGEPGGIARALAALPFGARRDRIMGRAVALDDAPAAVRRMVAEAFA